MEKAYVSATDLVKRRKKTYDEDLLESETMEFFFTPHGLLTFPLFEESHEPYSSREIEREALRGYKRGLNSIR